MKYDFKEGALLLIDKPKGWTSFDVVNKIRYKLKFKLGEKKIKVGHSGTLDPFATGLLLVCTGKSTKKLEALQNLPKIYTGTITLGASTPSFDPETEIDATYPVEHITEELIEKTRRQFLGAIQQIPPIFSAIKVDGQPLYKKARKGEKVEIKPRPVHIFKFDIRRIAIPELDFVVECSKGTYIRSLANDFGHALGSGAFLSSLCRTQIGNYKLSEAWNLDELTDHIEREY